MTRRVLIGAVALAVVATVGAAVLVYRAAFGPGATGVRVTVTTNPTTLRPEPTLFRLDPPFKGRGPLGGVLHLDDRKFLL